MLLSCLFVYNNVIGYVGGTGAISDCLLKNVLILFRSTVHPKTRRLVTIECITSWKCCGIAWPLLNFNWMKPHVHVKLGENRATIHFLLCLIHRRNPKFLPLNCLITVFVFIFVPEQSSLFGLGAITAGLSQVVVPEPCPKCQGLEARQSLCRLYLSKGKGSALVSGLLV